MRKIHKLTHLLLMLSALAVSVSTTLAADPGAPYPLDSEASDQKAGAVLFYNIYTSKASAPSSQDTRINITNISQDSSAIVHLFFVDGATCTAANTYICLTPNQTASFLASEVDPGISGYLVAVVVDKATGCPAVATSDGPGFPNCLIGDEYVKFEAPGSTGAASLAASKGRELNLVSAAAASSRSANLTSVACASLATRQILAGCAIDPFAAQLAFDGVSYNRLPRALAVDNIPDRASGNDTLLILNRIGGNLTTSAATLGSIFGLLYDDAENPFSFTFQSGACQFRSSLSNNFPRVTRRFDQVIPAGRSGWMKLFSTADQAMLGAVINYNPNTATSSNAFDGGHNLHTLTLTSSATLTIPVFPPNC